MNKRTRPHTTTSRTPNEEIFNKSAAEIASFYGFHSLRAITEKHRINQKEKAKRQNKKTAPVLPRGKMPLYHTERLCVLKVYLEDALHELPPPLLLFHNPSYDNAVCGGKLSFRFFGLDIIHVSKSIAEAIIIQVAISILKDHGYKNLFVEINSLGDTESRVRFLKEAHAYYRRSMHELTPSCKDLIRRDIIKVMTCTHEKCAPVHENAPVPINFLNEQSRTHFTQVLEYLESMEIPYRINNILLGADDSYSKTVFEIHDGTAINDEDKGSDTLLAQGGRYDELARKMGSRKPINAVGISLCLTAPIPSKKKDKKGAQKKIALPKIFLIQLGFEAKLASLRTLELLREAQIPVHQTLSRDRISGQLSVAERMRIPYTIIIGQREAMDHTVIVRNMETRSQEVVPIASLIPFLKRNKKI